MSASAGRVRSRGVRPLLWMAGLLTLPLLLGLVACGAAAEPDSGAAVGVRVDPRVELLSVIFRLAGNPEYNQGCVPSYNDAVEQQFGPFREHAVVKLARELRQKHGVSYDACMSLAIHVGAPPQLELGPLQPWPETLDRRWTPEDVAAFVAAARQFAEESHFAEFVQAQRPLYQQTETRMKEMLAAQVDAAWFGRFFGGRPRGSFAVVPALLNGPHSYGPQRQASHGQREMYCILGVWKTDAQGLPTFERTVIPTVVHEFCHSYANPVVDRFAQEAQPAAERILALVKEAMERQAYGEWKTVLYESLVRACTIRYLRAHDGEAAAAEAIVWDESCSFRWMRELVVLLEQYEAQRDRYPTLDDFRPQLVQFFQAYAERAERQAATQPHVVSIMPANGAKEVDPGVRQLKVVFDRPMQKRWALIDAWGQSPPQTGQASFDATGTIGTVPIHLEPSHHYQFMLNSPALLGFMSQEGSPLEPVTVQFDTASQGASAK